METKFIQPFVYKKTNPPLWKSKRYITAQTSCMKIPQKNGLMSQILSEENISQAFRHILLYKTSHLQAHDKKDLENLLNLSESDRLGKIRKALLTVHLHLLLGREIIKKEGTTRKVVCLSLMDKILEQCVKQVIEPLLEQKFHPNSYAYRLNRNIWQATEALVREANFSKNTIMISGDIHDFFSTISQKKLIQHLKILKIRDESLLYFLECFMSSPVLLQGRKLYPNGLGLHQGEIIAPLLSNVYLDSFDRWMSEERQFPCTMIRYADDFRVLTDSQAHATLLFNQIRDWLDENLNLSLNEEKTKIIDLKSEAGQFLGFTLTYQKPKKKKLYLAPFLKKENKYHKES